MSLLGLFEIGKSALMASQTGITTTSHNIANVNTPGYNRQEVILSIASPVPMGNGFLGRGVTVQSIRASYDQFIQAQLLSQQQNTGRSSAMSQSLSQVEQAFNETQTDGISAYLSDFFNAWSGVSSDPGGQPQRMLLLQKADSLAQVVGQTEQRVKDSLDAINASTDDVVSQINRLAGDIAHLNGSIVQAEGGAGTGNANDLRAQRDYLMTQLADLTQFSTYTNENGSINITVGMRNLVVGDSANQMTSVTNNDGGRDISLDGVTITDSIGKGQLSGLLDVRASIESGPLTDLRRLVASVVKEVNLLHQGGFGLDGSTGNDFFSPLQLNIKDLSAGANASASITSMAALTLDEYTVRFDATATNYSVINKQTGATVATGAYVSGGAINFDGIQATITGAVTATDTFTISPLTDAIRNFGVAITDPKQVAASSTLAGIPGNGANAVSLSGLSGSLISDLGSVSFSNYYQGIISGVGTMSAAAADSLKFDNAILGEVKNQRESISGVSLDEEAANLIQFQRSYEAGARMIKIADELMQTILNI